MAAWEGNFGPGSETHQKLGDFSLILRHGGSRMLLLFSMECTGYEAQNDEVEKDVVKKRILG